VPVPAPVDDQQHVIGGYVNMGISESTASGNGSYRKVRDRHREGTARLSLGSVLQTEGRFEEAIANSEEAASIFRETGDRHREAMALANLGGALYKVRRFDEAISAAQTAAAICRDTGDRHNEGTMLNNLGIALQESGRYEDAIIAHQKAAEIFRQSGDRYSEKTAQAHLDDALGARQVGGAERPVPAAAAYGPDGRKARHRHARP
jgi:tetratricopeptide (TPR) repeat protein